jgi:heat shock protein HslJ
MKRFAFLLSLPFLAACGGQQATAPINPADVTATTWRLQTIEPVGSSAITVPTPDQYTLRLEAGRVSVRTGCNGCGGAYTLEGDRLILAPLACTLVGCPPESLEAPFLAVLGTESRLSRSEDTLSLTSAAGTLRFIR